MIRLLKYIPTHIFSFYIYHFLLTDSVAKAKVEDSDEEKDDEFGPKPFAPTAGGLTQKE